MTLANKPIFNAPSSGCLETWEVANGPFAPDSLFIAFGATDAGIYQIGTAQTMHGNHFKPVFALDVSTGTLTLNGVQLVVP